MKKLKLGLLVLSAVATLGLLTPAGTFASPDPDRQEDKDKNAKPQSFSGKVEAVDTTAKTLTVSGSLIYVTADTKLTNKDKAVTLGDIKVGDSVHGTTQATFDGKTEALTVKVGAPEKEKDTKDKY